MLASASPARLALLRSAGIEPVVRISEVDEDEVTVERRSAMDAGEDLSPLDVAALLARAKAVSVGLATVANEPGLRSALVVGADSILEWDGRIWGKPASILDATVRWKAMRGTSGLLHTGHCVIDLATDAHVEATASTLVHFAQITDYEIDAYVATGEPLAVAGGFTLDGLAAPFIDRIEGDPSNVIGLSLPLLRQLVRQLNIDWTDLWTR